MSKKEFQFADLVHSGNWQSIQDSLAEALGLSFRTFSPNCNPLTRPSKPNALCDGILHKNHKARPICNICKDASIIKSVTKTVNFKGPFGLDLFAIPIRAVGDAIVAYIFLGPVVMKARRDADSYVKEALELDIDPGELRDAMIDINVFS